MNLINYYERCNKKISSIFPPFGNDFYHFYEMKIKKNNINLEVGEAMSDEVHFRIIKD